MLMLRLGQAPDTNASDSTYNRCLSSLIIPAQYLMYGVDKSNGTHQCKYSDALYVGISFLSTSKIKLYASGDALLEVLAYYAE